MNRDIKQLSEAYQGMRSPSEEEETGLAPSDIPSDTQWEVGDPTTQHQDLTTYADYHVEGHSESTGRMFTGVALYSDGNDDISGISNVQEIKE